jgi:hypothetical protein
MERLAKNRELKGGFLSGTSFALLHFPFMNFCGFLICEGGSLGLEFGWSLELSVVS